jgi:intracellular sulfur oxidation DsrE/DsrF family protein
MNTRPLLACWIAIALAAAAALPAAVAADKPSERVVLQVSDGNTQTWNQALNVAENLRQAYGPDTQIELVAFGQGINMLKFDAPVASRLMESQKAGVKVYACEISMGRNKLTRNDMASDLIYVEAGVKEIITRQREGWVAIRP